MLNYEQITAKKREILKKVNSFSYQGFIYYMMKNSDYIRMIILKQLLFDNSLLKSELMNVKEFQNNRNHSFDLTVYNENGYKRNFELTICDIVDDLVAFMVLKQNCIRNPNESSLVKQFALYVISDSQDDVFDKYINTDLDIKKVLCIDKKDSSLKMIDYFQFHFVVSLDHLNTSDIVTEFDELMCLFKHNRPHNEETAIFKEFKKLHDEYLNSDYYLHDLVWEFNNI